MKIFSVTTALLVFSAGLISVAGADSITPDLKKIAESKSNTRWAADINGKDALFARNPVWIDGVTLNDGVIECDILGKNAPRGSNFLGLGFRGVDDTTFDCVYFRPFNFRAENPENASHAVQYISQPQWTWQKLRDEKTGQYEKPITPPLDGDAWFHAKIVIAGNKVTVFVNNATKPSLEVQTLNDRTGGRVAIWGGDAGEGGYFANLKITPK